MKKLTEMTPVELAQNKNQKKEKLYQNKSDLKDLYFLFNSIEFFARKYKFLSKTSIVSETICLILTIIFFFTSHSVALITIIIIMFFLPIFYFLFLPFLFFTIEKVIEEKIKKIGVELDHLNN